MLVMLLNQELMANPESEVVRRFVDVDKDNKIFQTVLDVKDLLRELILEN